MSTYTNSTKFSNLYNLFHVFTKSFKINTICFIIILNTKNKLFYRFLMFLLMTGKYMLSILCSKTPIS